VSRYMYICVTYSNMLLSSLSREGHRGADAHAPGGKF
jgi:hypothetical protein